MKAAIVVILLAWFILGTFEQGLADGVQSLERPTQLLSGTASGATRYDKIVELFKTGVVPTQAEMTGTWSGRCFGKGESRPTASALVAYEIRTKPDHKAGPLFPQDPTTTFNVLLAAPPYDSDPEHFDKLERQELNRILRHKDFKSAVSQVENGSVVTKFATYQVASLVRKVSDYFLSIVVVLKDRNNAKAGDIIFSCYYFEKVY